MTSIAKIQTFLFFLFCAVASYSLFTLNAWGSVPAIIIIVAFFVSDIDEPYPVKYRIKLSSLSYIPQKSIKSKFFKVSRWENFGSNELNSDAIQRFRYQQDAVEFIDDYRERLLRRSEEPQYIEYPPPKPTQRKAVTQTQDI